MSCWLKCVPGFSEASGALIRITVYGFGGVTARYRLSVFFFPPVAPLAPCIAPPAPFDSETPSLSDPSDAAVVSSPTRDGSGERSSITSSFSTPPSASANCGGEGCAPTSASDSPSIATASVSSPMPVSAFHCLRTHARFRPRGVGAGEAARSDACDGLGRLEETPKPSALTVAKTSAGDSNPPPSAPPATRPPRRPPRPRPLGATPLAAPFARHPSSHSASWPAPASGPGPGAPAPERTPTATSRSRGVGATR